MPKVKTALRAIPRIYRQQSLDSIMFGYVWAMRRTMPHLSMTQILAGLIYHRKVQSVSAFGKQDLAAMCP